MDKSDKHRPAGDPGADIGVLRQEIDQIDKKIMDLINQRFLRAKQIGFLKKQHGIQIIDQQRERKIIDRLLQKNSGPLDNDGLRRIFAAIIAEGRNVQHTDRKLK